MSERTAQFAWSDAPPRRRRHVWPWLVAFAVVAALAVAAWFIAEHIVRGIVVDTIRERVVSQLALPADQQVDVEVGDAPVLPQVISGSLDDVTISSNDLPIGATTGDVSVHAEGVPVRDAAPLRAASGTLSLSADQLTTLVNSQSPVRLDSLALVEPDVEVQATVTVFGVGVPVGVGLTPSAANGDVVLSPQSFSVAGATLSADDLAARLGSTVSALTDDRTLCLRGDFPAGLTVERVAVTGSRLVADFGVDPKITVDAGLQQNGSCA